MGIEMRFLVTGGAGFIGSNFIRNLLFDKLESKPTSIVALDALTYAGNIENLKDVWQNHRFNFVHGDIRDKNLVKSLVRNSDIIFNFAAESHVDRSIQNAQEFLTTNVFGTATIAESCIDFGDKQLVHISTDEVYGSIGSGSWDEGSLLEPNSPYAASKAAAEMILRGLGRTHNLNYKVTRCSNNFGPFQHREKFIPNLIWRLMNNLELQVYGNGKNVRDWIYVDDHCRAIDQVALYGKPQEIYNIGGKAEMTNNALVQHLLSLFGNTESKVVYVPDRKNHDLRYSLRTDKITGELGFVPQINFIDGLRQTIAWYRANSEWFFKPEIK